MSLIIAFVIIVGLACIGEVKSVEIEPRATKGSD